MPQKVYPVAERYGMLRTLNYVWGKGWRCICDCGNETIVLGGNLRSGSTVSCGCRRKEHGKAIIQEIHKRNNERTERGELWGVFKLRAEKIKYKPRPAFLLTSTNHRRKGNPCWVCRIPTRSMLCDKCGGKNEQDTGRR